jgi:organic hydroperoxide reductase OsmC/OhrA
MQKTPVEFSAEASSSSEVDKSWIIQSSQFETKCDIPVEFGGQSNGFSPEDLFLQAAINCFIGTFKVMTNLSRAKFEKVLVKGKLIVDKNNDGKTVMKAVHLEIQVVAAENSQRIKSLVQKAIKEGFILNSLTSELSYSLNVNDEH